MSENSTTENLDRPTFDEAPARLRVEHIVTLEWLPGTIEWACSCGARSKVSPHSRTERQVSAASDRHLRAEFRRIRRGPAAR